MVKDSKKSSSYAAKVVAGVPPPPVRSSVAEKGTKLRRRRRRRNPEKKKKKIVEEEEEQVGKAHAVGAGDDELEKQKKVGSGDVEERVGKAHAVHADELEKQIVKLRKELDSQDAKRDAWEARANEAENKLQDYTLKLENLQKINDELKKRIRKTERALQVAEEELMKVESEDEWMEDMKDDDEPLEMNDDVAPLEMEDGNLPLYLCERPGQDLILPDEDSKTLYANNLRHRYGRMLKEADFEEFFREVGKVVNVQIELDPRRITLVDFAKIEFESHDVAVEAMKMTGRWFLTGPIQLNGVPKLEHPKYDGTDCTDIRPIISCFGFGKAIYGSDVKRDLKNYFSSVGEVARAWAPSNDNGLSKGCAYIEFKKEESFHKAFDLDGTLFLGSPLHVRRAKVFVTNF